MDAESAERILQLEAENAALRARARAAEEGASRFRRAAELAPIAARFEQLPVGMVDESPRNPRKRFDPAALAELTESVRSHGVVEPILVRPVGEQLVSALCVSSPRQRAISYEQAITLLREAARAAREGR